MTLDEAIKHAEEVAEEKEAQAWEAQLQEEYGTIKSCKECAEEHRQLAEWLKELKKLREQTRWIPVKWHEITEEEREKEGYPSEWVVHLDCILPEDGEEILITTKNGYVEKDTAYCDDGYYLDSGYDWVDDVVAWMPLPEPYKAESEEKE